MHSDKQSPCMLPTAVENMQNSNNKSAQLWRRDFVSRKQLAWSRFMMFVARPDGPEEETWWRLGGSTDDSCIREGKWRDHLVIDYAEKKSTLNLFTDGHMQWTNEEEYASNLVFLLDHHMQGTKWTKEAWHTIH